MSPQAPKEREKIAHGASRGDKEEIQPTLSPGGATDPCHLYFLRPSGAAARLELVHPRLTPWAMLLRPYGARKEA
jgi:hypothetical protein